MKSRLGQGVIHLILGLFCAACVLPVAIVLLGSFRDVYLIFGFTLYVPWNELLSGFSLLGYRSLFSIKAFSSGLLETVLVVFFCAMLSTAATVLAAYALSREDFAGRRFFRLFLLVPVLFSAGFCPTWAMMVGLGFTGSTLASLLPVLMNPLLILVMAAYIRRQLPAEQLEAARLDGCGEYRAFWRIALPAIRPGVLAVGFISTVTLWNEWFYPGLMNANYRITAPLSLLAQKSLTTPGFMADRWLGEHGLGCWGMIPNHHGLASVYVINFAMITIILLPILLVAPFIRKHVIALVMPGLTREE